MEQAEYKSASGWIVTYKPFLTYGQSLEIQKFLTNGSAVTVIEGKTNSNIDSSRSLEALQMTIKLLVVKVVKPDNSEHTADVSTVILDMPSSDAREFEKIVLRILTDSLGTGDDAQKKMMIS